MTEEQLQEIEKRYVDNGLLFDDYRKMSVSEVANMRLAIKRLYKEVRRLQQELQKVHNNETVNWNDFDQY